jgi:hypothetical protein
MKECIFVDEELYRFDHDEDEPLLPSTSSLELVSLPHVKQTLLRLLPLPQEQWRCHELRGRSSSSREVPLALRKHIHLDRSYVIWMKG